jgi:hypothetical protein
MVTTIICISSDLLESHRSLGSACASSRRSPAVGSLRKFNAWLRSGQVPWTLSRLQTRFPRAGSPASSPGYERRSDGSPPVAVFRKPWSGAGIMSSRLGLGSAPVTSPELSQRWWWMCTTLRQNPHHPVVDLRRIQSTDKRLRCGYREPWHTRCFRYRRCTDSLQSTTVF